ncbi:MAG: type II toxin-antitoxin system VapC family toxin [Rhodothermales bacterium]
MIRYLLDTNIVSELSRPDPHAHVLAKMRRHGRESAISSVCLHELVYGVVRLPDGRKKAWLSKYLETMVLPALQVLEYDSAASIWHARERARLTAAGQTPAFVDGMIAATAASRSLILVTRNERDFASFQGLSVVNWFEN